MLAVKRHSIRNKKNISKVKISAIMTVYNEELYIRQSIESIIDNVDEIIISDDNSTDNTLKLIPKSSKIKIIPQCSREEAILHAKNDWVLRWDGDWIAMDNFPELFNKITSNIDIILTYAFQPYGDMNHINPKHPYKINDCWLKKKKGGSILHINDPDKFGYYFVSLSYVKPIDILMYRDFKNEYQQYKLKMDFKTFFETILQKNYSSSILWCERNYFKDLIKHSYKIPQSLQSFDKFKVINGPIIHHDIKIDLPQIHDYEITLIILVRNTHKYLETCLNSVYRQTSNRWRILIINDTPEIPINIYHKQIKVINLTKWHGLIKCHKIAMMNVETPIVGILDSDDMLADNAVESVLKIYNAMDNDIFVYSNFWYCDADLNIMEKGYCSEVKSSLLNDRCSNHFRTFKTKHYFMTQGYDDNLCFGAEDQDILIQLEQFAKPYFLNKFLYYYRRTGSSISTMTTISLYSLNIAIIKNIIIRFGSFNPVLKIYSDNNKPNSASMTAYYWNISKIVINGIKYYFEIYSHDIKVMSINFDYNQEFLLKHLTETEIPISLSYSNDWIVDDSSLPSSLSSLVIFTPNHYFGAIYSTGIINVDFTYTIVTKEEAFKNENNHKKIMIIDGSIKQHMEFKTRFNKFIRSIPYDWYNLDLGAGVFAFDRDKLYVTDERNYSCKLFSSDFHTHTTIEEISNI